MPEEQVDLIFRIELASGSVHEHTFDLTGVTPDEFLKMDMKDFYDLREYQGGFSFLTIHSPSAIYNLSHVARWGIVVEGAPELDNVIKDMGFLARER